MLINWPFCYLCTTHNINMTLKVLLEQGEDGWIVAHVPALRGCISQGKTRDEAIANIKEAIELWLEVAQDREQPPTAGAKAPEVVAVAV